MIQPTWAEIAKAIENTIAAASGLPTIWRHQGAGQPDGDYVGMSLGASATVGVDWINERYDGTRPAHQQIILEVGGVRELPLQLELWSSAVVDEVAKASALSALDAVVTRLRLPAARDALRLVGVVPFDPGPVNWLPAIVGVNFRGRATCDVRCRMPARAVTQYADWIASIHGTATVGLIAVDIEAP